MLNALMAHTGLGLLAIGWYAIFMIVALPLMAVGWILYIRWDRKMQAIEDAERKKGSGRLQESRSEVSDWAQQMAKMEKPKRRPPAPKTPDA